MKWIIGIVLLGLWLTSCSDFLEESSQDEIRPSTINDMDELLVGEGYPELFKDYIFNTTEYFTDDIMCNGSYEKGTSSSNLINLEKYRWQFGWQPDMFDKNGGGDDRNFWEMPYENIKGCNLVLEYIDKVSGDTKKKEHLRGEAYALRGFYYFMLVNYFGLPYNQGDPKVNPGVPLKLTLGVTDQLFTRNSVAEVYRSVEDDLLKGIRLMEENKVDRYYDRMNCLAAKALLSRVYLYMEQWDKALDYADQVIKAKPALLSLASLSDLNAPALDGGVYSDATPTEIIWARQIDNVSAAYDAGKVPYTSSANLISLYETSTNQDDRKDLRKNLYFMQGYNTIAREDYHQFVCKDRNKNQSGIRTAEMYLNRAEAYIRKFMETKKDEFRVKALADLNSLREYRYDTRNVVYVNIDIQDAEALFKFYKEERRRELCGEGNHRWFDLRRWGMPQLQHVYFVKPGEEQTYTLEEKSSRYALPIPSKAYEYNPKL